MRPSGSGKPSSRPPWPKSCGGAGAARWAAVGMSMKRRYCRRIRWTWLGGLGPWAKAGWQSGMRAASNRIVPLRASTAVPSRAARRIRRQYLRLIDVPTAAHLAAPAPAQVLGQGRRELGLPLPDRLIAEHDAAHGEHLGQVAQAQFVAQAPEHHERDDVGGVLGPVQQGAGALIELLTARAAAEPAIALGSALGSLRHGFRSAFQAPHLRPPLREKRPYNPPKPSSARGNGASPDRTDPRASRALRTADRGVSGARYWLLFLQRWRRFPRYRPQGQPTWCRAGLPDRMRGHTQDGE